ncbi:uncharacterized protein LOC125648022 isoform X2 [Ostrea edulis]|uniref:uncharacterized protein LOC125648022 isoform X2 n=1 Tax=Ostrea edulis TaxID=37623 RepID=UPI0024AF28FE|nr:uncharacterized protein LOC125648022 isoform X2 [Ostrea edulis]
MKTVLILLSVIRLVELWCRPNERADIVFIFEESYSTGEMRSPWTEWNYEKDYLGKIVNEMYIDPDNGIRVAGITYNTEAKIRFYLNTHTTKSAIISAITGISTDRRNWLFENDTDYSYKGLQMAYDSIFVSSRGDRADVPNYYIYTTDYIFSGDNPYNTGLTIRNAGDNYIWAIGVKSAAGQSLLSQSVGSDGKYFTGSSFQSLNTVANAEDFWLQFWGCPLVDPAIGKYYCFLVPLLYFEEPAQATASTETCEQDDGMMFLMQDPLFEINCCGLITAWEFYPCTVGIVQFMVWTFKSGTTYELKAIQEVEVIDTDLGSALNYTVPEEERIAIVEGDRIGWRTAAKNIVSYQACDYLTDRYCPQNTYRTQYTDDPYEYMQMDWSAQASNTSTVEKLTNRGYTLKVYANNNTEISFEETFYLTSAADHWPIGTSFSSFALLGQDYKENVTFSWAQSNSYIDLNESYSFIQVARQLEPSESPTGLAGYQAKLRVVDTCRNTATTTFSVETFNGPPVITNFPKEMAVLETQGGSEFIYNVAVYDPTVPPDAVCCTLESVRPQTLNFEIKLINSTKFLLYTYEKPIFAFKDVNSYMLTVCCEDGFGTVKGILKIDVTEVKEKETYEPPSWFFTSVIASLVPIAIMFLFACCLLCFSFFLSQDTM